MISNNFLSAKPPWWLGSELPTVEAGYQQQLQQFGCNHVYFEGVYTREYGI